MVTPSLVVTDLDGTLWPTPANVPAATRAALHDVIASDTPLLVATGRRLASTRGPLAELGAAPPAVVLNGGIGLDLASGRRFHTGGFGHEAALSVLTSFDALGQSPVIYVDDDALPVSLSSMPSSHPDHVAGFGDAVRVGDHTALLAEHVALGFSLMGISQDLAEQVAAAVGPSAVPHVFEHPEYPGYGLTVAPLGMSKWEGILAFCADQEIDDTAVLVMGDGPNDLEMLESAAVAVVPADGHPAALALADHVIPPAADAGWAEVLDLLG